MGGAANQTHAALGTAQWSCSGRKAAAVREPSHGSPGAPSSALLPHRAYLKLPACHWDQRQGPGWEGRVSAGPLVKLTAGAKTSNLNPISRPPQASLHTSKVSSPASQLHLVLSSARKRGAALAGARCCWKSGSPSRECRVPAPHCWQLGSTGCWG